MTGTPDQLFREVRRAVKAAASDPHDKVFAQWAEKWLAGEASEKETSEECLRLFARGMVLHLQPKKRIKAYSAANAASWYHQGLEAPAQPSLRTEARCIQRLCRMAHTGIKEPKVRLETREAR